MSNFLKIKRINDQYIGGKLFSGVEISGSFGTKLYPDPISAQIKNGTLRIGNDETADDYRLALFPQSVQTLKDLIIKPSGGGGVSPTVSYYIGDLTVTGADTYLLTDVHNTTGRNATMIDNTGDIGVILDGTFNPKYMATASLVSSNSKANFAFSIVPFDVEIIGIGVSNFESGSDSARVFITIFED